MYFPQIPDRIGPLNTAQSETIRKYEKCIKSWAECKVLHQQYVDQLERGEGLDALREAHQQLGALLADFDILESQGLWPASDHISDERLHFRRLSLSPDHFILRLPEEEYLDYQDRIFNVLTAIKARIACLQECAAVLESNLKKRSRVTGAPDTAASDTPADIAFGEIHREFATPPDQVIQIIKERTGVIRMKTPNRYCAALLLQAVRIGLKVDFGPAFRGVRIDFGDDDEASILNLPTWYDEHGRDMLQNMINTARSRGSKLYHPYSKRADELRKRISQMTPR